MSNNSLDAGILLLIEWVQELMSKQRKADVKTEKALIYLFIFYFGTEKALIVFPMKANFNLLALVL